MCTRHKKGWEKGGNPENVYFFGGARSPGAWEQKGLWESTGLRETKLKEGNKEGIKGTI